MEKAKTQAIWLGGNLSYSNKVKQGFRKIFGLDLNSPTPDQIALPEGGDFRGLSQIMLAKLEKTSLYGWSVTQVIPWLRAVDLRKGGDQACPAWCSFQQVGQLDNIKMDPSHFPRRCHWRLGFGDRHPDVLQMVANRLVGQCQSECTHTLCHGVLAPTIVSLNTSFFIFHLPQQLWKRRRLCKADFINSHPFLEMTYYGRINTIEHRAMHASYGTQCNLYGYCLLSDLESYLVILGQLESCYI